MECGAGLQIAHDGWSPPDFEMGATLILKLISIIRIGSSDLLGVLVFLGVLGFLAYSIKSTVLDRHKFRKPTRTVAELCELSAPWTPPTELSSPLPRGVKLTFLGALGWVFMGLITAYSLAMFLLAGLGYAGYLAFLGKEVWALGLVVVVIIVLTAVARIYFKVMHQPKKLLQRGLATGAVVTRVREVVGRRGRKYPEALLEFASQSGCVVTGILPKRLEVGQLLTVVYDQENPTRYLFYPAKSYRLAKQIPH